MARAVSEQVLGRRTSIRTAYGALRGRVWALILSSLIRVSAAYGAYNMLYVVVMMISLALAALGTLGVVMAVLLHLGALLVASLLFIYLAFVGQIIVIERRGTADALSRSWRLVSGRLWRTSAIVGLFVLLVAALAIGLQWPLMLAGGFWVPMDISPEMTAVVTVVIIAIVAITSLLASPILSVGMTLMYYDLRVRREGFDVEMMAASLGESEAGS
jgi:hypothetical protein